MRRPLQQEMLKNQWKNIIFHSGTLLSPPTHLPHAAVGTPRGGLPDRSAQVVARRPPPLRYYCSKGESLEDRDQEDPRSRGTEGNPGIRKLRTTEPNH